MNKLTAKEALAISQENDKSYEKDVNEILAKILEAGRQGKYSISISDYGFGSGNCYTTYKDYPEQCKYILNELRALGYNCSIRCEELQFVSMWLEVSWK